MKSPEQIPPAQNAVSAGSGNAPTIQIDGAEAVSNTDNSSSPSLTPAAAFAVEDDASSVAVWNRDKRVNGLYTTHNAHNSWMSITGIGWQHLTTANDAACEVMTVFAAHSREKNSRIDYLVDAGLVNEIYIW
jgi:hypothetical protein